MSELRTVEKCSSNLETALKMEDRDLVHYLNQEGFYSNDICDKILDPHITEAGKAGKMVKWIKNRVKQDPESYHTFVGRLKQDGKLYGPIVRILEEEYKAQGEQICTSANISPQYQHPVYASNDSSPLIKRARHDVTDGSMGTGYLPHILPGSGVLTSPTQSVSLTPRIAPATASCRAMPPTPAAVDVTLNTVPSSIAVPLATVSLTDVTSASGSVSPGPHVGVECLPLSPVISQKTLPLDLASDKVPPAVIAESGILLSPRAPNTPAVPVNQSVPAKTPVNYSLKLKDGQEVRRYQNELAAPGIKGENYILVAPTGSGKTLVAALVISDHLEKNKHRLPCHVVFVVNTRPLADQQKKQIEGFIPGARVEFYTGAFPRLVADSIREGNDVSVCTAGRLREEIRRGSVGFDQISLIIFDECHHHAQKGHTYARLMELYFECREKGEQNSLMPQIIGMTATPGAGENRYLERSKTIDHLLKIAASLNATGGFHIVTEKEFSSKISSCTLQTVEPRDVRHDRFIDQVVSEMVKLEESVPDMTITFPRWSQMYRSKVNQVKKCLELEGANDVRDAISTLDLLRCYANALVIYMDLRQHDAVEVMEKYAGFTEDSTKATPHEIAIKQRWESLLKELKKLTPQENPLLENVMKILLDTFRAKPNSRAILFVPSRQHAFSLRDWSVSTVATTASGIIKPDVITGRLGISQEEQEIVVENFRAGHTNLLIATSVAEEGIDILECNLVIRYQYVSTEIGQVQAEGRARAENSQGITILSSNSNKKYQELKNRELSLFVEGILLKKEYLQDLEKELKEIQKVILHERRVRVACKEKQRQSHASKDIRLICKRCKEFCCHGSDIYLEGPHRTVPDPEFEKKFSKKKHHKLEDLIAGSVFKTHKIYCMKCGQDWGIACKWRNGDVFPVLKCVAFTFEIGGMKRFVKKWSDAPFEMKPLSEWLLSMDDSSGDEDSAQ